MPLVALQYHEVKLYIRFNTLDKVHTYGSSNSFTITQSGTTVTQSGTNPGDFVAADVNKTLNYKDGTTTTISSFTSGTIVEVGSSKR